MERRTEDRITFGGKLSAVLVAAGSAVGLGNIWRFPYIVGEHGGGAFLLIYVLCVLLFGLPIMLAEMSIGRSMQSNAVGAFRKVGRRWAGLGYLGVLTAFLLLGFYYVVSGWTLEYMIHSLTGDLAQQADAAAFKAHFEAFITNPWRPVLYTAIFVIVTHLIIVRGVKEGIERSSKWLMPLLLVILVVLAIRSLFMEGGGEGLRFLFRPDFSKVTVRSVLVALGQAFFSLSLGIGLLVTYGSYFKNNTNLRHTALHVTAIDTLVAVVAGVVVFPTVFSAGIAPSSGPSLVFITLPCIFQGLPLSMVWSTIFFLLLVLSALTSTISLHEVVTAYLHEDRGLTRVNASRVTTVALILLGSLASLSNGVLSHWTISGMTLFEALDSLTGNVLFPLGGLLTCIFAGWFFDRERFRAELSNQGQQKCRIFGVVRFLLRYLCPAILLIIFLDCLHLL